MGSYTTSGLGVMDTSTGVTIIPETSTLFQFYSSNLTRELGYTDYRNILFSFTLCLGLSSVGTL